MTNTIEVRVFLDEEVTSIEVSEITEIIEDLPYVIGIEIKDNRE